MSKQNGKQHVLDGVRVLDFTQYLAGPTCARALAELGAEVIKVEWAPMGDYSRKISHIKNGRSAYFVQHNRGKKSLCMELRKPAAIDLLKRMMPQVDVVVENYTPGVIARLGLGWDVLHPLNPQLILCSISGFGQTGPLKDRPGYDHVAQAYTGFSNLLGHPGEPPSILGMGIGDIGTGMNAACAVNAALFYSRQPGGEGQHLDISLLDTYFNYNDAPIELVSASGGATDPTRSGHHHYQFAPLGFFRSNRGAVCIMAVNPGQWQSLLQAMGRPELAQDPRFLDHPERLENLDALVKIIEDWILSLGDDETLFALMEKHRVPYAPVLTTAEAMAHAHARERGAVRTMPDKALGQLDIPGPPFRFSAFPELPVLEAPFLGQHNQEVLGKLLGLSAKEVQALEADGTLGSEPIPA